MLACMCMLCVAYASAHLEGMNSGYKLDMSISRKLTSEMWPMSW